MKPVEPFVSQINGLMEETKHRIRLAHERARIASRPEEREAALKEAFNEQFFLEFMEDVEHEIQKVSGGDGKHDLLAD